MSFMVSGAENVTAYPADLISVTKTGALNYSVYLAGDLDRETNSSHTLTFRARDTLGNDVPRSVQLYVTDVNDNTPRFEQGSYTFYVKENDQNLTIGLVRAEDPDRGINGTVRYSMRVLYKFSYRNSDSNTGDLVNIDAVSGKISLKRPLDFEMTAGLYIDLIAEDLGTPSFTSTVQLTILVQDVQDEPPFFTRINFRSIVYENVSIGTEILQVHAMDGDFGIPNQVIYNISGGKCGDVYGVNSTSGIIFVKKSLQNFRTLSGVCIINVMAYEVQGNYTQYGNTTVETAIILELHLECKDTVGFPCSEMLRFNMCGCADVANKCTRSCNRCLTPVQQAGPVIMG